MTSENMVTGYQYGDDLSFIGTYEFPDNDDQVTTHLPPRTTLLAPPVGLDTGTEAAFNTETGAWEVRPEDLSWMDEDSLAKFLAAQVTAEAATEVPVEAAPE